MSSLRRSPPQEILRGVGGWEGGVGDHLETNKTRRKMLIRERQGNCLDHEGKLSKNSEESDSLEIS